MMEEVLIHYTHPAHTDGDAVVYFKKANVIHMGDTFVRYGYPFVDNSAGGSVTGMVANLDQVIDMINDQTVVIPGHGELSNRSDMVRFRDTLKDIVEKVTHAMGKGMSLDEIQNAGLTASYDAEYGAVLLREKTSLCFCMKTLKNNRVELS